MALARGIKVLDQARIARVDRARYGRLPVEILISMMPRRSGVAPVTRLVSAIRVSLGRDGALPGQHSTAALEPDQFRRQ